jgi:hypothetical protein
MKPQFNIPRQHKLIRDGSRPLPFRRMQLATDYSYQPTTADLRTANRKFNRGASSVTPSFRDLSKEFLGTESSRSYAIEATLFAIIVAITAWPIATMAQAMVQLR